MNRDRGEKIHPYVAITIECIKTFGEDWERTGKKIDANHFPVCYQILNIGDKLFVEPADEFSSIQILRYSIKEEIREYSKDRDHIKFRLAPFNDKYVRNSLIDLERGFKDLEESQEVVICCPLHFLDYLKEVNSKPDTVVHNQKNELKILKLIHVANYKDKTKCEELDRFYHDYNTEDKIIANKAKILFYEDVKSLAKKWFKIIIEKFLSNTPINTFNTLTNEVRNIPEIAIGW